jgi:hypothetical protein
MQPNDEEPTSNSQKDNPITKPPLPPWKTKRHIEKLKKVSEKLNQLNEHSCSLLKSKDAIHSLQQQISQHNKHQKQ